MPPCLIDGAVFRPPRAECAQVRGTDTPRPACRDQAGRGRRVGAPYFLPIVTVAVPAGETQPAAEISVTESVTLPLLPAVKVIRLVPWPAVIVPFEMLQL